MVPVRLALALLVVLVAISGPARADDLAEARVRFKAGQRAYVEREYRRAIGEFTAANRLHPNPQFAYNIGRCHEQLGEYADAVRFYREYLRAVPEAPDKGEVSQHIADLERRMPSSAPVMREPEPRPTTDVHVQQTATEPRSPRHLRWTWVAGGTTAAALVGAAVASWMAQAKFDDLEKSCAPHCSDSEISTLDKGVTIANVLWGVTAAAAVVTGVVTWLELRSPPTSSFTVAPALGPAAAGLVARGSF
jgi:tetratricopeptide (TPR) repeat protein